MAWWRYEIKRLEHCWLFTRGIYRWPVIRDLDVFFYVSQRKLSICWWYHMYPDLHQYKHSLCIMLFQSKHTSSPMNISFNNHNKSLMVLPHLPLKYRMGYRRILVCSIEGHCRIYPDCDGLNLVVQADTVDTLTYSQWDRYLNIREF